MTHKKTVGLQMVFEDKHADFFEEELAHLYIQTDGWFMTDIHREELLQEEGYWPDEIIDG